MPLAMILFGMINWTFTWLRAEGPLTYEDMGQVVAEIFLPACNRGRAAAQARETQAGRQERRRTQELEMKLATLKTAGRDGRLIVVSRDLQLAVACVGNRAHAAIGARRLGARSCRG